MFKYFVSFIKVSSTIKHKKGIVRKRHEGDRLRIEGLTISN